MQMFMSSTLDFPPNMTPRAEGPAVAVDGERSSMSGDSGSSKAESNDSFVFPPGLAGHMGITFIYSLRFGSFAFVEQLQICYSGTPSAIDNLYLVLDGHPQILEVAFWQHIEDCWAHAFALPRALYGRLVEVYDHYLFIELNLRQ